jgi:hypothetical protein
LRRVNASVEEVVGKIIGLDGSWQFDDTNYSTFPTGYATLVASQNDYTFNSAYLNILNVRVLDSNGIWHKLTPIDKQNIDVPMEEYQKVDGLPLEYDKEGNSIILYPAPSASECTLTTGLRVDYQRTASIYTSAEVTTGTKEPGFASPFHSVIPYMASIPYCMTYKKDRVAAYQAKVDAILGNEDRGITGTLVRFYSKRQKDTVPGMRMRGINHR